MAVPTGAEVTYSLIGPGSGAESRHADPANPDAAGPMASIARGRGVDRRYWPACGADEPAHLPGARFRMDQGILNRRCTARWVDAGVDRTVVLLDGDDWIHLHNLDAALDHAVSAGALPPHNRLFLPAAADRRAEFTAPNTARALAQAIPEVLQAHRVVLVGQSLGGFSALRALSFADDRLLGVLAQSPSTWCSGEDGDEELHGPAGGVLVAEPPAPVAAGAVVHLSVGATEPPMHRHVIATGDALAARGFRVTVETTPGGHDPAMWRHGIIPGLANIFAVTRG